MTDSTLVLTSSQQGDEPLQTQAGSKLERYFTQRAELESRQSVLSLVDIDALVHEYRV